MQGQCRLFKLGPVEEFCGILQRLDRLIHHVIYCISCLTLWQTLLNIQRKRHFKFVISLTAQRAAKACDAGLAGAAFTRQLGDRQVEHRQDR